MAEGLEQIKRAALIAADMQRIRAEDELVNILLEGVEEPQRTELLLHLKHVGGGARIQIPKHRPIMAHVMRYVFIRQKCFHVMKRQWWRPWKEVSDSQHYTLGEALAAAEL
jgi:hypothetical protein